MKLDLTAVAKQVNGKVVVAGPKMSSYQKKEKSGKSKHAKTQAELYQTLQDDMAHIGLHFVLPGDLWATPSWGFLVFESHTNDGVNFNYEIQCKEKVVLSGQCHKSKLAGLVKHVTTVNKSFDVLHNASNKS